MDERIYFWRIFCALKYCVEVLLVVGFVRIDVLSHTLWSVVAFETDILMQALFEEESQCSFTSFLGRCAFSTRFCGIFAFKLSQIVFYIIFTKVRLIGESWKKIFDVWPVSVLGSHTLPCQFWLPLSNLTWAFILNFHLAYWILECYSRKYLPIGSPSTSWKGW